MRCFPRGCLKKAAGFLLALCLLISCASAGGLNGLDPMLADLMDQAEQGQPLEITLSGALHQLVPFGEDTLQALNRLLEGCKLRMTYQNAAGAETTLAQLVINDAAALEFTQRAQGDQILLQTGLLPGTAFAGSSMSPMETLLDEPGQIPAWVTNVPDLDALFQKAAAALDGLSAFAQEKKVSYRINLVGTAKKALVYTVPEESSQPVKEAIALLLSSLPMGGPPTLSVTWDTAITLYQSAEGESMGLSLKGVMAFDGGSPRKVSFLWGCLTGGKKTVHTVSLKAPAVKGNDSLTVTGKVVLERKSAQNDLSLSLDIQNTLDKAKDKIRWTGKLFCLMGKDNQRLEGELQRTHTGADGAVEIYSIKPGLAVFQTGGAPTLQGKVRIAFTKDKHLLSDVTVSVAASGCQAPAWDTSMAAVSLDDMEQGALSAIREKAQKTAQKAILQAVLTLPKESLTLISSNITDEDWERLYKCLDMVTQ